jgi:hypothetical protein
MHRPKIILNVLVLVTVIGFALTGWLFGHILRHSSPALRHPPTRMPGEKVGGNPPLILERFLVTRVMSLQDCETDVYYTSLPTKCRASAVSWCG